MIIPGNYQDKTQFGDEFSDDQIVKVNDLLKQLDPYFDCWQYNYWLIDQQDNGNYLAKQVRYVAEPIKADSFDVLLEGIKNYYSTVESEWIVSNRYYDEYNDGFRTLAELIYQVNQNEPSSTEFFVSQRNYRFSVRGDHWMDIYKQIMMPDSVYQVDQGDSGILFNSAADVASYIMHRYDYSHLFWISANHRSIRAHVWIQVYTQLKAFI